MGVYRRQERLNGKLRKGKVWWISYMVAGRQKRESSGSTNKRVALKLLALRQAQVFEGRLQIISSKPPRFEDWAKKFMRDLMAHPNTKERYQFSINELLVHFKKARLSEITPNGIEEFKSARLARGVKAATVNRDLATLRRMLTVAKKRRLIGRNPLEEVEFLDERKQRRQPHILTFAEQERLLAAAAPRLRVLIVLLTETGLRVNKEAMQLRWEDIDLANQAVNVHDSKTPAGRRVLPLSGFCKTELERWKNLAGPEFSEFVFPQFTNPRHKLHGSGRKAWRTALKNAGLAAFPIYDLRHTFATRLHAAGESHLTVAQLLGHSDASIVQTYAKMTDEHQRAAIKKLEAYRELKVAEMSSPLSGAGPVN